MSLSFLTHATKINCLLLIFFYCFQTTIAQEQTIRYSLISDFSATDSEALPLVPLSNSSGQTGQFINTTLNGGFCPTVTSIPAYFFEDNTGLSFDNSNHFLNCAYTIEFIYRFTAYPSIFDTSGWLWLLGFTGTQDEGLFIYQAPFFNTTTLEFWDDNTILATVGQANTFVEDRWYKFSMTRDCNNLINVYVNGNLFGSYTDVNGLFYPQMSLGNQIIFFQDNPAILSAESSPGHIRELNISNYPKSAEAIAKACDCMCDILAADYTNTTTPEIRDTFEICSGETLIIDGTQINTDTTICQHFTNDSGCETTRCSTVFVIPIKETEIEIAICTGETYSYENNVYSKTGIYSHYFIDENGCDSLVYVDLTVFNDFSVNYQIQEPVCHGEDSGAITVLLSEQYPPYQYAINGGDFQSFNTFLNLESAVYNLIIKDGNDCIKMETITINSPPLLTASTTTQPEIDQIANGTATIIAEGGTPPYTYEWSTNPIQTTETAINLSEGNYQVTVTDANNCTSESIAQVDISTATSTFSFSFSTNFQIFPNPVQNNMQIIIDTPTKTRGQIAIYNATGQRLFSQSLSDLNLNNNTLDWRDFPVGVYWLSLTMEGTKDISYGRTVVKY